MSAKLAMATGCVGLLAAIACGSSGGDSTFGDSNITSGEGGAGSDPSFGGASSGASGSGGASSGGASSSGAPDGAAGGTLGDGSACAAQKAAATAVPVYLIFMFDQSGSMGQLSKWTSCVAGMEQFFGSPASAGLYASIQYFRQPDECNVAVYAAPSIPVTALPAGAAFTASLNAHSPNGGTPTLPALKGAIQYAQSVKAGLTHGEKVAVVLVTDGDPNDCSTNPNNAAAAAAEVGAFAATVASTIKTYVIGVGPDAANLNAIATGGGTAPAIMVSVGNPAQTTTDLLNAINQIKNSSLGCNYTLPPPQAGLTLDINAVNVVFTPGGGTPVTLPYSANCADPNGWHYDSTTAPTQIVMCASRCSALQADTTGGKIDIEFGCVTQGGPGSSSSSSSSTGGPK